MAVDNEQLMEKLTELHGDFREFRGEVKARLTQVEKDADRAEMWANIKTIAVIPVVMGLHALGIKVGAIKH